MGITIPLRFLAGDRHAVTVQMFAGECFQEKGLAGAFPGEGSRSHPCPSWAHVHVVPTSVTAKCHWVLPCRWTGLRAVWRLDVIPPCPLSIATGTFSSAMGRLNHPYPTHRDQNQMRSPCLWLCRAKRLTPASQPCESLSHARFPSETTHPDGGKKVLG